MTSVSFDIAKLGSKGSSSTSDYSDVTDISIPRGRDGSFNDSFPSLGQDMPNIGRPFNLRLQPELGNTKAYSDLLPAFLIGAEGARNNAADVTFAVINLNDGDAN